jgi:chromosome transmission fidelity protein 4
MQGKLPLSPKSHLTWFGFSSIGQLASCDSDGIVQILFQVIFVAITYITAKNLSQWMPLCDLIAAKHPERVWMFGLTDSVINCIILKVIITGKLQLNCIRRGSTFPKCYLLPYLPLYH